MRQRCAIAACCCILAGIIPYILWHQNVLFIAPFQSVLPDEIPFNGILIETIIRNHLADLLWFLALLLIQDAITDFKTNYLTYFAYILPFVCEICQIKGLISGTFDPIDLLVYLITLIIYIIWKKRFLLKHSSF